MSKEPYDGKSKHECEPHGNEFSDIDIDDLYRFATETIADRKALRQHVAKLEKEMQEVRKTERRKVWEDMAVWLENRGYIGIAAIVRADLSSTHPLPSPKQHEATRGPIDGPPAEGVRALCELDVWAIRLECVMRGGTLKRLDVDGDEIGRDDLDFKCRRHWPLPPLDPPTAEPATVEARGLVAMPFDPMELQPGVYRVWWKSGGTSVASVYCDRVGNPWLAPANWVQPDGSVKTWMSIEKIELLAEPTSAAEPGGHWWCERCQAEKSPVQVTNEENCTLCGWAVEWRATPAEPGGEG